jgi:hypothetical protein
MTILRSILRAALELSPAGADAALGPPTLTAAALRVGWP